MTGLQKHTYRLWIAMSLMFGLTVLPGLVEPLIGPDLASQISGVDVVLAGEPQGGGG